MEKSKYKVIDMDNYYRKDVFKHFSEECKCSTSITSKINVTKLVKYSKDTQTKFYINFLYILSKVLNSRDDYKMQYDYKSNKLIVYEKINPKHYIFMKIQKLSPLFIVNLMRIMRRFIRIAWLILKMQRKQETMD